MNFDSPAAQSQHKPLYLDILPNNSSTCGSKYECLLMSFGINMFLFYVVWCFIYFQENIFHIRIRPTELSLYITHCNRDHIP